MTRYKKAKETWPDYVRRRARRRAWGCGQGHKSLADDALAIYYRLVRDGKSPEIAAEEALVEVGAHGR